MNWMRSLIEAVEVHSDEKVDAPLDEFRERVAVSRVQLRGESDVPAEVGAEVGPRLQGAGVDEGAAERNLVGLAIVTDVGSRLLRLD